MISVSNSLQFVNLLEVHAIKTTTQYLFSLNNFHAKESKNQLFEVGVLRKKLILNLNNLKVVYLDIRSFYLKETISGLGEFKRFLDEKSIKVYANGMLLDRLL